MATTASNVSAGKPKVGGALYVAPTGTTLPTDATTALNSAFESLGYISDAGLTNTNTIDTTAIKAWGGDTVLNIITGTAETYKYTLIEVLNVDVLKHVFGSSNVTGDLDTGITVSSEGINTAHMSFVFEMIMNGGALKRIVIPDATITGLGDVTYSDSAAAGYETTISAVKDASGKYHYEYIIEE